MSASYIADETKIDYAQAALSAAQVVEAQESTAIDLVDGDSNRLVVDVVRMVEVLERDRDAAAKGDRYKVVVVLPAHCEVELKREPALVCFCKDTVKGEQELVVDGEGCVAIDESSHADDTTEGAA